MIPGLDVCGKTGTAQITNSKNEKIGNTVWFASYAPYEKARWVVVVMIQGEISDRLSGGGTCAPIARQIYLAIQDVEARKLNQTAMNP